MNKINLYFFLLCILFTILILNCNNSQKSQEFSSTFPQNIQRSWIGPEFWANPLQDWQLKNGRIECIVSGGDRNVFLLTHELIEKNGKATLSVNLGNLNSSSEKINEGWVGFRIGIRGEFNDYRDCAVRGVGLPVGITTDGQLFIGGVSDKIKKVNPTWESNRLELTISPANKNYQLTLSFYDENNNLLVQTDRNNIKSDWLTGGVAIVSHHGKAPTWQDDRPGIDDGNWGFRPGTARGGNVKFWFSDWKLNGTKVKVYPERNFGPILFAQYTLNEKILKLTTQLAPVAINKNNSVLLQVQDKQKNWQTISETVLDTFSRTATFKISDWQTERDVPYRVGYEYFTSTGLEKNYYKGTIRHEPWEKEEIIVAGFTGNNDLGFPNNDIIDHLHKQNPDFLFFSGDQIYEGVGGYGAQRAPIHKACLDYLRKWYIYGWTYRDLLRDRPSVSIPDDHDVYHGNIWGAGGIATPKGLSGYKAQDSGGYKMPPEWVNMVQRTQTSHLPDPFDPTPVKQGIGVYYCNINYAGISFAVLEDRKFKSAPKTLLPQADIQNGWIRNRNFDAKLDADVPEAALLGKRQIDFLDDWAKDWSNKTWMKVVLSQTIFANVATLPKEDATSDEIVPRLRILENGDYPPDDIPVSDMDSNGWPQTGRNKALQVMRSAFAFHLAGDQHLGSTIQYGVENWHDASFAFCVPAISNVWPRRWFPEQPGKNREPDYPKYTGDFEDGFGNKISVYAISNPVFTGLKPSRLYDRATGFGIVRFNRNTRDITMECWPRLTDPGKTEDGQYSDWPVKINQLDNFINFSDIYLPLIRIAGLKSPVIQIIDESNNEIVYSLRIVGDKFQPKVLKTGTYTIIVSEPDLIRTETIRGITTSKNSNLPTIEVKIE